MTKREATVSKACITVGHWLVMAFIGFLTYMASRFDFEFVWTPLLLILTTFGVFASLLVSYAAIIDDVNEKHLLGAAAREAINGSLLMAVGIILMGFYYLIFVIALDYQPDTSREAKVSSMWSLLTIFPLAAMIFASNCMLHAVGKYVHHAWRGSVWRRLF